MREKDREKEKELAKERAREMERPEMSVRQGGKGKD